MLMLMLIVVAIPTALATGLFVGCVDTFSEWAYNNTKKRKQSKEVKRKCKARERLWELYLSL